MGSEMCIRDRLYPVGRIPTVRFWSHRPCVGYYITRVVRLPAARVASFTAKLCRGKAGCRMQATYNLVHVYSVILSKILVAPFRCYSESLSSLIPPPSLPVLPFSRLSNGRAIFSQISRYSPLSGHSPRVRPYGLAATEVTLLFSSPLLPSFAQSIGAEANRKKTLLHAGC